MLLQEIVVLVIDVNSDVAQEILINVDALVPEKNIIIVKFGLNSYILGEHLGYLESFTLRIVCFGLSTNHQEPVIRLEFGFAAFKHLLNGLVLGFIIVEIVDKFLVRWVISTRTMLWLVHQSLVKVSLNILFVYFLYFEQFLVSWLFPQVVASLGQYLGNVFLVLNFLTLLFLYSCCHDQLLFLKFDQA